jgi:hypothetical protein
VRPPHPLPSAADRWVTQLLRCLGKQERAYLRRRVEYGGAAVLHGLAAGGVAFVGGLGGVGSDQRNLIERHIELLGGNLQKRGLDSLPQLGLAGEHRDAAIGRNANP